MRQYQINDMKTGKVMATARSIKSIKEFLKIINRLTESVQVIDMINHYEVKL